MWFLWYILIGMIISNTTSLYLIIHFRNISPIKIWNTCKELGIFHDKEVFKFFLLTTILWPIYVLIVYFIVKNK